MLQLHSFWGDVNDFFGDGIGIESNRIEEDAIRTQPTTRSPFVLQQAWAFFDFYDC
jgi:hypothetical protein